MSEATISFSDQEQVRILFGAEDRNLRRVRELVGVDVVIRGDELRLRGSADQIQQGLEVFAELKAIIEKHGGLKDSEVEKVLDRVGKSHADASISVKSNGRTKKVEPRSPGQQDYMKAIRDHDLVFCTGPAGSGKTYLAVAMAIDALRREEVRKIVLVRPAVEAGEKLGFLPGDVFAKVNPYLRPLLDALNDILDFDTVNLYLEKDVIEVIPLAFMRGRTLNNTFIILDEGQNTTVTQMKMFLTRMGNFSKVVATGDTTQIDLQSHVSCGLTDAIHRLSKIDGIDVVELSEKDIVRHRLVRDVVQAYDRPRQSKQKRRN